MGKVRHLDAQMLWVQQRVRNNDLDLDYVQGETALYSKPPICHASRAKPPICHARRVEAMRKTTCKPNGNPYLPCKTLDYLPCKTLDHLQKEESLYIKRPSAMQTGPKRLSVMQTVCKPRASQRANRRKPLSTMQTVGFFLRKRKLYII